MISISIIKYVILKKKKKKKKKLKSNMCDFEASLHVKQLPDNDFIPQRLELRISDEHFLHTWILTFQISIQSKLGTF